MNVRHCDFSNAKVGDKVFCLLHGEGIICDIDGTEYPICVEFDSVSESYLNDGRINKNHIFTTLYHNKFKIQIPEEAYIQQLHDIAVDTPMIVWNDEFCKEKRYFKEWSKNGKARCFCDGQTSFSSKGHVATWDNYEIFKLPH